MRLLDQSRAEHALAAIEPMQTLPLQLRSRYLAYLKGLPAMIITHGLGQSLAVLKANSQKNNEKQDQKAYLLLYQQSAEWLCHQDHGIFRGASPDTLMTAIVQCHLTEYMRAQTELLAFVAWLKKFAEALLADSSEAHHHD